MQHALVPSFPDKSGSFVLRFCGIHGETVTGENHAPGTLHSCVFFPSNDEWIASIEETKRHYQDMFGVASDIIGRLEAISAQYFTNREQAMINSYNAEEQEIIDSITNEEQRQQALTELEEKYDAMRAKIKREQAQAERAPQECRHRVRLGRDDRSRRSVRL